jgi:hypothetical protein
MQALHVYARITRSMSLIPIVCLHYSKEAMSLIKFKLHRTQIICA